LNEEDSRGLTKREKKEGWYAFSLTHPHEGIINEDQSPERGKKKKRKSCRSFPLNFSVLKRKKGKLQRN